MPEIPAALNKGKPICALRRGGKILRVHRFKNAGIGLELMWLGMIFHAGCASMQLCRAAQHLRQIR